MNGCVSAMGVHVIKDYLHRHKNHGGSGVGVNSF